MADFLFTLLILQRCWAIATARSMRQVWSNNGASSGLLPQIPKLLDVWYEVGEESRGLVRAAAETVIYAELGDLSCCDEQRQEDTESYPTSLWTGGTGSKPNFQSPGARPLFHRVSWRAVVKRPDRGRLYHCELIWNGRHKYRRSLAHDSTQPANMLSWPCIKYLTPFM